MNNSLPTRREIQKPLTRTLRHSVLEENKNGAAAMRVRVRVMWSIIPATKGLP